MKIRTKGYYENAYHKRMDTIIAEVQKRGSEDYRYDATVEFDETANTEEVVGYYLANEGNNAYETWCTNTAHLSEDEITQQDKDVTTILEHLNSLLMAPIKEITRGDEIIRVSTEDFEKKIIDEEGNYVSDEAKLVDETIYCYIPYDDFHSSEQYILNFIRENID